MRLSIRNNITYVLVLLSTLLIYSCSSSSSPHPAVGMWYYIGVDSVPYTGSVTNLGNSLAELADSCSENMYLDIQTDGNGDWYFSLSTEEYDDGEWINICQDSLITFHTNFINDTILKINIDVINPDTSFQMVWTSKLLSSGSFMESYIVIPDVEDGDLDEGYSYWEKQ